MLSNAKEYVNSQRMGLLLRKLLTKLRIFNTVNTTDIAYLDGQLIVLQGWVDHHDQGEWNEGLLLLAVEQF